MGISPGERKGYPLQYSSLENSMDCSPWGLNESDTTEQLSFFFFLSASSHFKHMKATKLESREFTDFGKCWTSVAFSPFSYPHHGQGRASSPFSPVLWEAGCLRRHSKRLIMMLMVDAALDPAETSKARGCRGKLRLLCRERETGLD